MSSQDKRDRHSDMQAGQEVKLENGRLRKREWQSKGPQPGIVLGGAGAAINESRPCHLVHRMAPQVCHLVQHIVVLLPKSTPH